MITYHKEADSPTIFSQFINKHIGLEHQDKVEFRKNNCPVCYLGRPGTKYLKIIIDANRNKPKIKLDSNQSYLDNVALQL